MRAHSEPRTERPHDLEDLQHRIASMDTQEVVDELGRLGDQRRAVAFRLLPKGRAVEVFEDLDPAIQAELVEALRSEATAEIFAALDPDDRASLLDELPAGVAARLLGGLGPDERALTTALLGYPEDSAGRRMSPRVASVRRGTSVAGALDALRRAGDDVETIYTVPVLGAGRVVEGVVSLRRLLVSDPDALVEDVMSPAVTVEATDDQEHAANVVRDGGYVAVPVVDHERRLLGVLTVDDAMRILEAEDDEDSARVGGSEPLRRPYLTVSVLGLVRARVVWLLLLIVAASLTVGVQSYFEAELDAVVALALFIPLLIGTGGNAGSQAATTVVRALAVGDIRRGDLLRVVGREMLTGLLLGTVLAAVGFGPAAWVAGVSIAQVLAITVVGVCVLATTVGSSIPILARRVGIDPAIVAAPFISTFVDTLGLVIYFSVAKVVLGI
ncbi:MULTISPECIES: magnesium transporter [Oerskovia]|uniref:Magnesium transporter MgtE n=2 Tax=Oerskovia TaxID=162491 RepID=A0ABR8V1Y9_9CELL|nr:MULTISPECIES: magnesium transporter [Oerskovia]MBD7998685.1 magnesium transporter [Oerskovia gallyi]MBM7497387.1 magnesium transporter [Oerskovia paurometabola]